MQACFVAPPLWLPSVAGESEHRLTIPGVHWVGCKGWGSAIRSCWQVACAESLIGRAGSVDRRRISRIWATARSAIAEQRLRSIPEHGAERRIEATGPGAWSARSTGRWVPSWSGKCPGECPGSHGLNVVLSSQPEFSSTSTRGN